MSKNESEGDKLTSAINTSSKSHTSGSNTVTTITSPAQDSSSKTINQMKTMMQALKPTPFSFRPKGG